MSLTSFAAHSYLEQKGAKAISHIRDGSLFDHLLRVEKILAEWNTPAEVQLAGLFHSMYGSSHFTTELALEAKDKETITLLIGDTAEELVTLFSKIDRTSLSTERDGLDWSFLDFKTKQTIPVSRAQAAALLHILLANAMDHLVPHLFDDVSIECNRYVPFSRLLTKEAKQFLDTIDRSTHMSPMSPGLRFLGHSGIWLKTKEQSLAIDPWLYSSTFQQPLLRGLQPQQRTIDYLIPRPVYAAEDIAPDIVLLSHLHTHHAPLRSIEAFAKLKPITVLAPMLSAQDLMWLEKMLGADTYKNITFKGYTKDDIFTSGNIRVRIFTHPQLEHLGFEVTSPGFHFMHITDARANRDMTRTTLDPLWEKIRESQPEILFITAANHLIRLVEGARRFIGEHSTLSAAQAAELSILTGTKRVGLIGMYNFSIWDSSLEYAHSAQDIQNEFEWVLSYMAPNISIATLKPGDLVLSKTI